MGRGASLRLKKMVSKLFSGWSPIGDDSYAGFAGLKKRRQFGTLLRRSYTGGTITDAGLYTALSASDRREHAATVVGSEGPSHDCSSSSNNGQIGS